MTMDLQAGFVLGLAFCLLLDELLERLFSRLSPSPAQTGRLAMVARRPVQGRGTNYLAWLHVRLFLEQQTNARAAGKRSAAAREVGCCASVRVAPCGNHGETPSGEARA